MPALAKSPEHVALGRALREQREAAGLTQEQLALDTGLHRNYVGACERGEVNLAFSNLLRLCSGAGRSLSDLVARYEQFAPRA